MALNLNVNGIVFRYPEQGDTNWGQSTTLWAQAVTGGMLQKAGGSFPLTANVDFGANFGLFSSFYASRSSNSAQTGAFRLASSDQINFRNIDNTADLPLSIDINNQLTFNGGVIQSVSVIDTATIDLTISTGQISADIKTNSITDALINSAAAISYSKLNLSAAIVNSDISPSAAIALNKLAPLTVSRAVVSDPSGLITSSAVTSTELGYVSGVTSAIQTQINSKLSLAGGTMTGSLVLAANPTLNLEAATKQYVDSLSQGLQVKAPAAVATTSNITLSGEQTIDSVITSSTRVLVKNQTNTAENGVYISSSGAWTRATDMDTWAELVQAYIFVQGGFTQSFSGWYVVVPLSGTIGVTPVPIQQFSQAGSVTTDGQGVQVVGSQISLVLDGSTLSKSVSGLKIAVGGITNTEVGASAAIALTKLAPTTASRALVSDASGFVSASAVTATELGYLSGVTSAIQTQINSKLPITLSSTGDMIYSSSGSTPSRLAIGTTGQVLRVASGIPTWSDFNVNPSIQSVSGNITLVSTDTNKYLFVSTASPRLIQLPAPAAGLNFHIKDSTGQAGTNNITLVRFASEQIEGVAASKVLQTNWGSWHLMSDGTNWFMV